MPCVALLTGSYSLGAKWDVVGAANSGISIISVLVWVEDEEEIVLWAKQNDWLTDLFETVCQISRVLDTFTHLFLFHTMRYSNSYKKSARRTHTSRSSLRKRTRMFASR